MILKIDTSNLDDKNKTWWNSMSINERRTFLEKHGWQDINWCGYKWNKLHTGLQFFINKKRNTN